MPLSGQGKAKTLRYSFGVAGGNLHQFSPAWLIANKDSAKVSRPWRYPCFYRKHVPDDIQGSYLRVMAYHYETTISGKSCGTTFLEDLAIHVHHCKRKEVGVQKNFYFKYHQ